MDELDGSSDSDDDEDDNDLDDELDELVDTVDADVAVDTVEAVVKSDDNDVSVDTVEDELDTLVALESELKLESSGTNDNDESDEDEELDELDDNDDTLVTLELKLVSSVLDVSNGYWFSIPLNTATNLTYSFWSASIDDFESTNNVILNADFPTFVLTIFCGIPRVLTMSSIGINLPLYKTLLPWTRTPINGTGPVILYKSMHYI